MNAPVSIPSVALGEAVARLILRRLGEGKDDYEWWNGKFRRGCHCQPCIDYSNAIDRLSRGEAP